MTNVLLVCASSDFDVWDRMQTQRVGNIPRKALTVPLHLGTVAGLTPADHHVRIWDEEVQGRIDDDTDFGIDYDLVGITAYSCHLPRAKELAAVFRNRRIPVVIGGAGVTADPEGCRDHFDVLFLGEAELTWPQFLADFKTGTFAKEYRSAKYPDLCDSPPPRWDSIAKSMTASYMTGGLQVNRGCPYTCEFCNVWIDFGRKIRTKPIEQVLQELVTLESLGMRRILICTDNFVGNPAYAKELLRQMFTLNGTFKLPLRFQTELTLNISGDEEMLKLLSAAGFVTLFIGIESSNEDSLIETRKKHNIKRGLVEQCRKIQSYGMTIQGSMIVGFDNDTVETFDRTFEFLQEACIVYPRLNLLKALDSTDLLERLVAEDRVLDRDKAFGDLSKSDPVRKVLSNIIPKKMTRYEMFRGYLELLERVWDWRNFEVRLTGFLDMIEHPPQRILDERALKLIVMMKETIAGFPEVNQEVVDDVIAYTEQHCPTMIFDVCSLIIQQCVEAAQLPTMRDALNRQIERERVLGDEPPLVGAVPLRSLKVLN